MAMTRFTRINAAKTALEAVKTLAATTAPTRRGRKLVGMAAAVRRAAAWDLGRAAKLSVATLVMCGAIAIAPPAAQAQKANAKAIGALKSRVQQLEGQVLDMQVMIGTLQSLARSGGGGRGGAVSGPVLSGGGADAARIRTLETQIQALTSQVERLARQVRNGRRSDAGTGSDQRNVAATRGGNQLAPMNDFRGEALPDQAITGFGATTVIPGDSIGNYLQRESGGRGTEAGTGEGTRIARARPVGDPKKLYETAYGYLLQQNFRRAQTAFTEFLELYPDDALAGNAQYWLGETFYVRRKYRSAANSFLKGYQKYARSNKAPDNLLKLSMSLDRLGQKDAACSSFMELQEKFPRAPAHVRDKTRSEIRRLKC